MKAKDRFTLTLGSQGPHRIRDVLCNLILKIPPEKMRVINPDTGGGFGTKLFPFREYPLAAVAAKTPQAPGEMGRRSHRNILSAMRRAATTSPLRNWRSTPTTSSSACGSRP